MKKTNKTYGGFAKLFEKTTKDNPATVIYAGQAPGQVDYGVTAATGSTQATGYKVTKRFTVISTCANAGDSLTLPNATTVGFEYNVRNDGTESAYMFPPVGGNINSFGANTRYIIASGVAVKFVLMSRNSTTNTSVWSTFAE